MGANGKWDFLVPVALAAAALLGTSTSQAGVGSSTSVQLGQRQQTDDLVVAAPIAPSTPQLAQHESHASHRSHRSHRSHYSSAR